MNVYFKAHALAARRARNPEREARRQQELTRMLRRIDYVPMYNELTDRAGIVVRATYLGHKAVVKR